MSEILNNFLSDFTHYSLKRDIFTTYNEPSPVKCNVGINISNVPFKKSNIIPLKSMSKPFKRSLHPQLYYTGLITNHINKKLFLVGIPNNVNGYIQLYFGDKLVHTVTHGKNDFGKFTYYKDILNDSDSFLIAKYNNRIYILELKDMERGSLDIQVESVSCKDSAYKIRCCEHNSGTFIGDYEFDIDSNCHIPNLNKNVAYDIFLIDVNGVLEYQVLSNRYPT